MKRSKGDLDGCIRILTEGKQKRLAEKEITVCGGFIRGQEELGRGTVQQWITFYQKRGYEVVGFDLW